MSKKLRFEDWESIAIGAHAPSGELRARVDAWLETATPDSLWQVLRGFALAFHPEPEIDDPQDVEGAP